MYMYHVTLLVTHHLKHATCLCLFIVICGGNELFKGRGRKRRRVINMFDPILAIGRQLHKVLTSHMSISMSSNYTFIIV